MKFPLKVTLMAVLLLVVVSTFVWSPRQEPTVYIVSAPATQVELVQDASDTVRNPYAPPVRHNREAEYTQLGYVESGSVKHPFFGKRACLRDKWFYYTLVDGLKLPVEYNRKKCSVAPGCDRISDGDSVTVDGRHYVVHIYESNQYEYNPFVEPL